jgi:hypothetical protein
MRRLFLLVVVGLITGCVNQLAVRQAELAQWVGRPETQLVEAMGVPTRTYETGGLKFLSYVEQRVEVVPGSPFYGDPFWYGYGYGGGFPPTVVNLACDTTFTIDKGVVRAFSLRGNACG